MIRVAIIGYTLLQGFFYSCSSCMQDNRYWMPYYIIDEIIGGGFILWYFVYKNSKDFKIPAFALFVFSVIRCLWNIWCYIMGINASNTKWTAILFFCLLPVVYWTLFAPDGLVTAFIEKQLKRLPSVKKDSV